MQKFWLLVYGMVVIAPQAWTQLVSGPLQGPVELRETRLWVATASADDAVELRIGKMGEVAGRVVKGERFSKFDFHTVTFHVGGLEPATRYQYTLTVASGKGKKETRTGTFTTKTLFQLRHPVPDFTFLTGSCAYFNEPAYDRPGRPYGGDTSIFETMAKEPSAFMLWLGDNWYTREVDYQGEWGLWYRAWRDRSLPVLQSFWASMPHLAIWDDHDYGPNDYGKSYYLKNTSREVFNRFWLNPSSGDGKDGIYTRYQYNDVDFFMLDDRWWRDFDQLPDSVNGQPNPGKRMLGRQQMDWLKQELLYSRANRFISFRVIVIGSQTSNPVSPFDKLLSFPVEYYELMQFIKDHKINGVLFLNGDRHHSEVIKVQPEDMYPLYDVTCSPLSSGTHTFSGPEANNPYRIMGVDKYQNYGRVTVSGATGKRSFSIEFVGVKGDVLGQWSVNQQELMFKK